MCIIILFSGALSQEMGDKAESRTRHLKYFLVVNVCIFFKCWKSVTAVGVCYPNCYDSIENHMINDTVDSNAQHSDQRLFICHLSKR
jgi:hypothetical protein